MSVNAADVFLVKLSFDTSVSRDIARQIGDKYVKINEILKACSKMAPCIHKFKVTGEQMVVMVFKVKDVADFENTVGEMVKVGNVKTECTPLIGLEQFAENLGIDQALTKRESDNYISGISRLLWYQGTVKYDGKPVEKMMEDWKKEVFLGLTARGAGKSKFEAFKHVSQYKITSFAEKSLNEFDKMVVKLPLVQENASGLNIICKPVQNLEDYLTLPV